MHSSVRSACNMLTSNAVKVKVKGHRLGAHLPVLGH